MNADFAAAAARLMRMARHIEAALSQEIAVIARETMEDARENAPVGEGPRKEARLIDSFSYEADGLYGCMRVVNPHAAYVEFGTGRRGAESADAREGGMYDAEWPGMAAQPYMQPAADRARADFAARLMGAALRGACEGRRDYGQSMR